MSQSWMCVTLVRTQAGSFPGLNQTAGTTQSATLYNFFQHKESQYD